MLVLPAKVPGKICCMICTHRIPPAVLEVLQCYSVVIVLQCYSVVIVLQCHGVVLVLQIYSVVLVLQCQKGAVLLC